MRYLNLFFVLALFSCCCASVVAQEQENSNSEMKTPDESAASQDSDADSGSLDGGAETSRSFEEATKAYEEATKSLREATRNIQIYSTKFLHRPAAESDSWRKKWEDARSSGFEAAKEMKLAAVDLIFASASVEKEIVLVANARYNELVKEDQNEKAYHLIKRLEKLNEESTVMTVQLARMALRTDRYDEIDLDLLDPDELGQLPEMEKAMITTINDLKSKMAIELEMREAQTDLPLVELETSKGKIVVELFEDDSPETVANFIYLVESGFYDRVFFHSVIRGFVAETGLVSSATGRLQAVEYKINDEFKGNKRLHFRGVLSMSNQPDVPNSGASQFFINYLRNPGLDGKHTVFGRVVENMQAAEALNATAQFGEKGETEPIEDAKADMIISAKVIRKRDHEYKPTRVKKD